MNERVRGLLFDVLNPGRAIEALRWGRSFSDYQADGEFRHALQREFKVIGELLSRVASDDRATAEEITNLPPIVNLHHSITNRDAVDDAVIWAVIVKHIPALVHETVALVYRTGAEPSPEDRSE